ncbi:50S ribosomal protein L18 [Candidatus Microgenomates bacterium]|nr:50S ribosomal protein L18 [Candidatus Microgenomates bacterium]
MNRSLRMKRHYKVRKKVVGTSDRPRLSLFRSNKHIYVQIIDDSSSKTLVFISDVKQEGTKLEKAYKVGKKLAEMALKNKIKTVVFDRGGFLYHGRIAEVARGAREGGLKF